MSFSPHDNLLPHPPKELRDGKGKLGDQKGLENLLFALLHSRYGVAQVPVPEGFGQNCPFWGYMGVGIYGTNNASKCSECSTFLVPNTIWKILEQVWTGKCRVHDGARIKKNKLFKKRVFAPKIKLF